MKLLDRLRKKHHEVDLKRKKGIDAYFESLSSSNMETFVEDIATTFNNSEKLDYYRLISNHLGLALFTIDLKNKEIIYVSRKIEEILEISKENLTIEYWKSLWYQGGTIDFSAIYARLTKEGKNSHTYRIITPSGAVKWINETTVAVKDEMGNIGKIVGVIEDCTNALHLEQKINFITTHDELTNLPNFLNGSEHIQEVIESYKTTRERFALFCVNLDGFSRINNTLGFKIADEAFKQLSIKLEKYLNKGVFLFRSQGDEWYAVVECSMKNEEYMSHAKEIIDIIQAPLQIQDYSIRITASIGISVYPDDGQNKVELIKNANTALKRAKKHGVANYQLYAANMNIESFKTFQLETDLQSAIKNGELYIEYQPKVDVKSQKATSAEALIRWKHPLWGEVSPLEFITIAEESNFHREISEFVIDTVSKQVGQWEEQGIQFKTVSFNLSAKDFLKSSLISILETTISRYQINPKHLEIELTEGTLLQETSVVQDQIEQIKAMGISLSLDDFGTGYSSIHYLKKLPSDIIKIDRSFIQHIHKNVEDKIIVKSIIELTKGLNKTVVAEGVENEEQFSILQSLGCDLIQGYYYSKSVSSKRMTELFKMSQIKPASSKSGAPMNRRKYYRVSFPFFPLHTEMTIVSFNGKAVTLGTTDVMVLDIGLGGLRFVSHLKLKPHSDILYNFKTTLLGKETILNGTIVRYNEKEQDMFEYGVEFQMEESDRDELASILNKISLQMKQNPLFNDGDFIDENPSSYLSKIQRR
ncbi:EAL domain-containing protein [Bacillus sp. HNG]|uniref:EAL domain-containing protein n=1 Tax=Bacillus sp. HNG TaxID=2293325 RepID=UPI001671C5C6|nr:EAL domain-containing protein [Bacillus sp. HNG]